MPLFHYQKLVNSLLDICSVPQLLPNVIMSAFQRPQITENSWGSFFNFPYSGVSGERKVSWDVGTGITGIQLDSNATHMFVADRITWNLSAANNIYNGENVTPISRACKFFIRYM